MKPWHVKWELVEENTWEGTCPINGHRYMKVYDPCLDLTKYFQANQYDGWSLFACIRED